MDQKDGFQEQQKNSSDCSRKRDELRQKLCALLDNDDENTSKDEAVNGIA